MADTTTNKLRSGAFCLYLLSWILPATGGDGWTSLGIGAFVFSIYHAILGVAAAITDPSRDSFLALCSGIYFGFLAVGNNVVFAKMFKEHFTYPRLAFTYMIAVWCVPAVANIQEITLDYGYAAWAVGLTIVLALPPRGENHKTTTKTRSKEEGHQVKP